MKLGWSKRELNWLTQSARFGSLCLLDISEICTSITFCNSRRRISHKVLTLPCNISLPYYVKNSVFCCWLLSEVLYSAAMLVTNFWPHTVVGTVVFMYGVQLAIYPLPRHLAPPRVSTLNRTLTRSAVFAGPVMLQTDRNTMPCEHQLQ